MQREAVRPWRIAKPLKRSCRCWGLASKGMRYLQSWEQVRRCMTGFKKGKPRASSKRCGRRDDRSMTSEKGSSGNGRAWMEPCGICPGSRGAATGANPTDRGKQGTKRSLLTDGAGIPLALVVEGANRHDVKRLCATLDGIVVARRVPSQEHPEHRCLDGASDADWVREVVRERGYQDHLGRRGQQKQEKAWTPGSRAGRWVVERTHSWLNGSRRLLVRWEKKTANYLAFLPLACAQLIFSKVLVFG